MHRNWLILLLARKQVLLQRWPRAACLRFAPGATGAFNTSACAQMLHKASTEPGRSAGCGFPACLAPEPGKPLSCRTQTSGSTSPSRSSARGCWTAQSPGALSPHPTMSLLSWPHVPSLPHELSVSAGRFNLPEETRQTPNATHQPLQCPPNQPPRALLAPPRATPSPVGTCSGTGSTSSPVWSVTEHFLLFYRVIL